MTGGPPIACRAPRATGLKLLPTDFRYREFAALIFSNGIGPGILRPQWVDIIAAGRA